MKSQRDKMTTKRKLILDQCGAYSHFLKLTEIKTLTIIQVRGKRFKNIHYLTDTDRNLLLHTKKSLKINKYTL